MNRLSGIGIEICFEHHAPEKWPWLADCARELGVSFVRLGEFIWVKQHGIKPEIEVPRGIHYAKRVGKGIELYFFFNTSQQTLTAALPAAFRDFETQLEATQLVLPSRQVRVLERVFSPPG